MFSLASIATMAACLFIFGVFYCIGVNVENTIKEAQSAVGVTVFFKDGVTEDQILEVEKIIELRDEVDHVVYISAEQAWEDYKAEHFSNGDPELIEGLDNDNPLANSANLEVYLSDTSRQAELVTYIGTISEVRTVNASDFLARSFTSFNRMITYVFSVLILVLLLVAIFLISNTITVGVTIRKEEIAVMKYIGATDGFVRGPFLLEGTMIGIIGSVIPLLVLWFMYDRVIDFITSEFAILRSILSFLPQEKVFVILAPAMLIVGVGIGFLGSYFTTRRHIKV